VRYNIFAFRRLLPFPIWPSRGIEVNRIVFLVSLLLLLAQAGVAAPVDAAEFAAITYAEQPVRLLRDKSFYLAARGARLQSGDIVESATSTIQIAGWGATTVALGPTSRLYLTNGAGGTDYVLLSGWMKLQSRAPRDALPVTAGTSTARFDAAGVSVIVRAAARTELFVEAGEAGVDELDAGKVLRRTTVKREHYAARNGAEPLKTAVRAPKEFLGAMPRAFLDPLVAVGAKAAATEPKLERAVALVDVAPWVAEHADLRQAMQRRFQAPKQPAAAPQHVRNIIY
jgi:hypothetical protein